MTTAAELQIRDEKTGRILVERLEIAAGFLGRLRGLLGRSDLEKGRGLILAPCKSVHTFTMRFNLDIVMLGPAGKVLAVYPNVPSGRAVSCPGALAVLEMQAGWSGPWTPGSRVVIRTPSGHPPEALPAPLRFLLS